MIDVTSLLTDYGLPIAFFGSILEGESVVVLAAYAARQDLIAPTWGLFLVAMLGSFIGDQIYFWIGRYWGKPYLAKRPDLNKKIARLHGVAEKYETAIMFGSRFMYGFRIALPVTLGLGHAKSLKYAALNLLGSATWATIWISLGWYAYDVVESVFSHTKKFERTIVIGLIIGVVIAQGIGYMKRKIEEKVEEVEVEIEEEKGEVRPAE